MSVLLCFKVPANVSAVSHFASLRDLGLDHLSTPGNSCTCFSLAVHCCRDFSVHQGSGKTAHTRDVSCAPNGRTCLRSSPWHKVRNNCNFSGLGTLGKGNILKCSFCFPTGAAGSLRCESSTCEGQGCVLCTGERTGQSSAQRHNQDIPWGRHFLGFHGKVVGSAVKYHCAEDKWGGGGRNLCHIPPTSLVYIP